MKKLVSTVLLFLMVFVPVSSMGAVNGFSEIPLVGTPSPYEDYGFGFYVPDYDGIAVFTGPGIVEIGQCEIHRDLPNRIRGYAKTIASKMVDEVGYTLHFQMWNGVNWINIESVSNRDYNFSEVEGFHFKTVERYRYYRLMVEHYVVDKGITDHGISYSNFIYLD